MFDLHPKYPRAQLSWAQKVILGVLVRRIADTNAVDRDKWLLWWRSKTSAVFLQHQGRSRGPTVHHSCLSWLGLLAEDSDWDLIASHIRGRFFGLHSFAEDKEVNSMIQRVRECLFWIYWAEMGKSRSPEWYSGHSPFDLTFKMSYKSPPILQITIQEGKRKGQRTPIIGEMHHVLWELSPLQQELWLNLHSIHRFMGYSSLEEFCLQEDVVRRERKNQHTWLIPLK